MDKEVVMVEITSCDMPTAWYASLVGHRFECYEWGKDYVLKQDYDAGDQHWWRHITKDNCVVVSAAEHHAHLTGFPPNHRDEPFCECDVCMGFVSRTKRQQVA